MVWKRISVLFASAWYLLCASQGLAVALDATLAASKTVEADADFACASHGCGCATAEQAAKNCCCFPGGIVAPAWESDVQEMEERSVRVSFLAAEACRGTSPLSKGTGGFAPHLLVDGLAISAPESMDVSWGIASLVLTGCSSLPPDKIPIAVS